jgi:hypothetical protein
MLSCGEYLTCFSECVDEACTQVCAELVAPQDEAEAIALFLCMGANGCGAPGPNADVTCISEFCSAEHEVCYGEALSTPQTGGGSVDKEPGGSETGIPTIGGGDSTSGAGGSVTIGGGGDGGDGGGCRTSAAPGGTLGILLLGGLLLGLRRRVLG